MRITIFQNGPWGSLAQQTGWADDINGSGWHWADGFALNGASSWESDCAWGTMWAGNGLAGDRGGGYGAHQHGNFPWGNVGNDDMESANVNGC